MRDRVLLAMVAVFLITSVSGPITIAAEGKNAIDTDYDYGFSLANEFRNLYESLATVFWDGLEKLSLEKATVMEDAEEHIMTLRECYPRRLERLMGLSDALDMPLVDIVAISLYLPAFFRGGCTTLAAVPPATLDDEIYTSWNVDIMSMIIPVGYLAMLMLFVVDIPGQNRYVGLGIPGILEIGLLNDKGLTYVGNMVMMTDGGRPGLNTIELNNLAMETCSKVEEVAELYERSPRRVTGGLTLAGFTQLNNMYTDLSGNAATIEYSHNHIAVKYANESKVSGVLVETNHHQYIRELSGSPDPKELPPIVGSYCRLGRAWELAEEYQGKFDLNKVKEFCSDHGTNYTLLDEMGVDYTIPPSGKLDDSTICGHYWNIVPYYLRHLDIGNAISYYIEGVTLFSIIIQPKEYTIYITPDKPCSTQYIPFYFADLLGVEGGAHEAGGSKTRLMNGFNELKNDLVRSICRILPALAIRRYVVAPAMDVAFIIIGRIDKIMTFVERVTRPFVGG